MQKKIDIISKYDQTADKYNNRYREIQDLKISTILEKIPKYNTELILDLGIGTGLLFDRLKNFTNFFVGIDISKKMLEEALESHDDDNLYLICADADFLPFRGNLFSSIFSVTLLQNLPDPRTTIDEAIRVCKEDGIIVFTILKKGLKLEEFENLFNEKIKKIMAWNMQDTEDFAIIIRNAIH